MRLMNNPIPTSVGVIPTHAKDHVPPFVTLEAARYGERTLT